MITEGLIDEDTGRELAPVAEIELFSANEVACGLFQRCSLQYVSAGMGALRCTGMALVEIAAALRLFRVKGNPRLIDDVLAMANAAAGYLNEDKAPAHG